MIDLPWDSEFFGVAIARHECDEHTLPADIDVVISEAQSRHVECLYLALPASVLSLATYAIARGAVLTDIRVVLRASELVEGEGQRATEEDADTVVALAENLAPYSRFARDARFDQARVVEMYRRWARRCLSEGIVVLTDDRSAFVGVRSHADVAHLDLVYVAPERSGQGVAQRLFAAAAAEVDVATFEVATQAGNVAALRSYERAGFRATSATIILHAWLDAWQ